MGGRKNFLLFHHKRSLLANFWSDFSQRRRALELQLGSQRLRLKARLYGLFKGKRFDFFDEKGASKHHSGSTATGVNKIRVSKTRLGSRSKSPFRGQERSQQFASVRGGWQAVDLCENQEESLNFLKASIKGGVKRKRKLPRQVIINNSAQFGELVFDVQNAQTIVDLLSEEQKGGILVLELSICRYSGKKKMVSNGTIR